MKSYWLWILLNVVVWPFAIAYLNLTINQFPICIFEVAFYFLIFFYIPLIEKKIILLFSFLSVNTIMATAILFPYNEEFNPFLILILSLLMAEGFYRLPLRYSIANGAIDAFGLGITALNSNLEFVRELQRRKRKEFSQDFKRRSPIMGKASMCMPQNRKGT